MMIQIQGPVIENPVIARESTLVIKIIIHNARQIRVFSKEKTVTQRMIIEGSHPVSGSEVEMMGTMGIINHDLATIIKATAIVVNTGSIAGEDNLDLRTCFINPGI